MKNKKLIVLIVVSLVLTACISKEGLVDEDLESLDFVLDWTPNTNHIGVYVAIDQGYYKEEGLHINVIQPPEDGPELLIAAGKGDIGVSFQDSLAGLYGQKRDIPITAIGTILQRNTSGIISRKEKNIQSPKDMEGKSYGAGNWQLALAIVEEVVRQDGGDWSKVELLPIGATDELSSLEGDLVDSIWVYYGWAGIATELAGLKTNYFAFRDIEPTFDYYTPVFIAHNDLIAEQPEKIRAFLRATKRGYEFAIENPQQASQILAKADSSLDEEMLCKSIEYLAPYYIEEGVNWAYMDQARWDRFFDWVYQTGLIENQIADGFGMTNDLLP